MTGPFLILLHVVVASALPNGQDPPSVGEEVVLTKADFERGRAIVEVPRGDNDNPPMENPDLFEGDIIHDTEVIEHASVEGVQRNALRARNARWTNGRVPYTVSSWYSEQERAHIAAALEAINNVTCLKIEPRRDWDRNYVAVNQFDGCNSHVGMKGGRQVISLGNGCLRRGTIQHEFMHALGFFHEQSRADRDQYVTVHFDNIQSDAFNNFQSYSLDYIDHLEENYDYKSVMHYAWNAFSKNGKVTIETKDRYASIGQREGLSQVDIRKINKLYECADFLTTTTEPTTTTAPLPEIVWPTFAPGGCKDKWSWCHKVLWYDYCTSRDPDTLESTLRDCPKTCGLCDGDGNTVPLPDVYTTNPNVS